MQTQTHHKPCTSREIGGVGHSLPRVEDARFLQGAGNYLDDVNLPGMLHMAILRSPVAHAKLVSIDSSAAMELDGVLAVVTGELMAQHNLAWMPTLSGDTQAVLATDKVRYQGQEVACVIATDRYIAEDALRLIDVDYEELEPITNPQRSLEADAPLIRTDKEDVTDNVSFTWEAGDKDATDAAFAKAAKVVSIETHYPRSHPSPLETCGIVADVHPATGKATIYMTSQAPHAHRTLFALVAGLPEQNIRIISPDIGGGFGNKVLLFHLEWIRTWALEGVMGLPPHMAEYVAPALSFGFLLALAMAAASLARGLLIAAKRTGAIAVASGVRLATVGAIGGTAVYLGESNGALIGMYALIGAFVAESAVLLARLLWMDRTLGPHRRARTRRRDPAARDA